MNEKNGSMLFTSLLYIAKIFLKMLKGFAVFILILLVIISLFYFIVPVYNFPDTVPFQGNKLFNPYENLSAFWFKGNFQVASLSWGGITDGRDPADEVFKQYAKFGYDVISITDYQKINSFNAHIPQYIPAYEHGYNVWKRHHLCLAASTVNWFDLPLFQTVHHKQFIINLIKKGTEFLVLAHPIWMNAFTNGDMQKLVGYDAIEVLNHYRNSVSLWDAALSAGHAVWIISNDDSHNIYDLRETMRFWTMINAQELTGKKIISAMKRGCAYGVEGVRGINENSLLELITDSLTMSMILDTVASEIRFIGQNGQIRSLMQNTDSAIYVFTDEDTYIRTEIVMEKSKMYLNPVIRFDGRNIPQYVAQVNLGKTWLYRVIFLIVYVVLVLFYLYIRRKHKRIITIKPENPKK